LWLRVVGVVALLAAILMLPVVVALEVLGQELD